MDNGSLWDWGRRVNDRRGFFQKVAGCLVAPWAATRGDAVDQRAIAMHSGLRPIMAKRLAGLAGVREKVSALVTVHYSNCYSLGFMDQGCVDGPGSSCGCIARNRRFMVPSQSTNALRAACGAYPRDEP